MAAQNSGDSAEYEDVPMTPERRKFLREMEESQRKVNAEHEERARKLREGYENPVVSPEMEKQLEQEAEDKKFREAAAKAFGEKKYAKGGTVKKAVKRRGDGCCIKGKTKGRMV